MSPSDFQRQRTELLRLLELGADARAVRLAELAAADPNLHDALVSLLAHQDTPASLVDDGLVGSGLGTGVAETLDALRAQRPERIGPYEIREVIGEGGMGVVYRAEQTAPVQREVAIKHIRLGMDTARIVARFQAESQALARMNHPHIASLYDAGVDEAGRPYFVMELVAGSPVTHWCRDHDADLDTRLDIFLTLCSAVQHAHQKGIIHRDLKPGNLLVTTLAGQPHPKVIDFGIAKALDESDTEMTLMDAVMGSPHYMSPEQLGAFGGGADTRSDVYALGVVLYELLTGSIPYRIDTAHPDEIRRIVIEERPESPRDRLGGRHSGLPRDLDTIVMMALRKDPSRRYSSVDQFADDIRHLRRGEPVIARANSWRYRTGRFIGRNRLPVGALSLLMILLLSFTGAVVHQSEKIRSERNRAVSAEETAHVEAETAQEVTEFLVALFADAQPAQNRGQPMSVRELADSGAARVRTDLADQPAIQWRLLATLGDVYAGLGLEDAADTLFTEAMAVQMQVFGPEHPEIAGLLEKLGTVAHGQGNYPLSASRNRQALDMLRRIEGTDTPRSAYIMNSLAVALEAQGDYETAEPLYEEALALNRRLLGDEDPEVAWGLNTLGQIRWRTGNYLAAQVLFQEAVDLARKLYGGQHPDLCAALNNLGGCLLLNGDLERGRAILQEALDDYRTLYNEDHPGVGRGMINLGGALVELGRTREALALYENGAALQLRLVGPDHLYYARSLGGLGRCLVHHGRPADGVTKLRQAVAVAESATDPRHPDVARQLVWLSEGLIALGETDAARAHAERALDIRLTRLGPDHPLVAQARLCLAEAVAAQGDRTTARAWAEDAVAVLAGRLGPDHYQTKKARVQLRDAGLTSP